MSPDNEKVKRVDPVVLQGGENLPVTRTTRSGRPIENSPVKNKSAGIAGAPKVGAAKKLVTQPNS